MIGGERRWRDVAQGLVLLLLAEIPLQCVGWGGVEGGGAPVLGLVEAGVGAEG